MHERSLAQSLLTQIAQVAEQHVGTRPQSAAVEIGPLSGVEPLLLESAFVDVAAERGFPDLLLVLKQVPLGLHCRDCHQVSESISIEFQCPKCGSHRTRVTHGDALILVHVDLVTADAAAQDR
jgi:hydrogenase nickel incorporation protein HypA/HybF